MIYVTGDIHGQIDRFKEKELKALKKKDTLFVLGDFGFLWDGSRQEEKNLHWLEKQPYRILFLDGCHENFDLLSRYPQQELLGGQVRHLGGNLYYVCRGSILELENRSILCMGGGESEDIEDRDEGVNWWRAELPGPAELTACREALAARGDQVDYILTHDAPGRILEFLGYKGRQGEQRSSLQVFFNDLNDKMQYRQWLFGRYHLDRMLGQKMRAVFCEVVRLDSEEPQKKKWIFKKAKPAPKTDGTASS